MQSLTVDCKTQALVWFCRPHIRQLLLAHGVIVEGDISDAPGDAHNPHAGCRAFDHMEAGLQYCEERFLQVGVRLLCPWQCQIYHDTH